MIKERKYKYDISVVIPSMNEGEAIKKFVDELLVALEGTNRTYEIISIDTPSENLSYPLLSSYAKERENFTSILLSDVRKAGSDKSIKYMIGFELAKGRYIIQMDTDGQDNPADLPKFLEKLDDGYDLVVGHKQNRKDGKIYMLSSKIGNTATRILTGTDVHDMNCGFKGYQSYAAKSLNLRGRWYRYIPSILNARGYKITEVPIENRKREWGKTNFSFFNRLQAGLFDMLVIAILNKFGDTPMYFWGWVSLLFFFISLVLLIPVLFLDDQSIRLGMIIFSANLFIGGILTYLSGVRAEFARKDVRIPIEEYGYKAVELPSSDLIGKDQ